MLNVLEQLERANHQTEIKFGLERIESFLEYIGNPQKNFRSILITGTNGKGSVTFYISNLLCKYTDYKIGRYISPHLISWSERFVINESIVSDTKLDEYSRFILHKTNEFEKINPLGSKLSVFETLTAVAFYMFANEGVDVACLEVGMGGRLDATNVIKSENLLCSVITNVSLDHTHCLGSSVEKIAYEKSGIIKENNSIITAAQNEALDVITGKADELKAKINFVDVSLCKSYKEKNILITVEVWDIISTKLNLLKIEKEKRVDFLQSISFPGRFQIFPQEKIILDGAHNPDAAIELRRLIDSRCKDKKIIYILGMLNKDYTSFIKNLIPLSSRVVCTEPVSDRATKKESLVKTVAELGANPIEARDLGAAIEIARSNEHDYIVITGSLYLVGEALKLIEDGTI